MPLIIQYFFFFLKLDLPLSITMYRWLLGHENYLTLGDLSYIVPEIYKTLSQLHQLVLEKRLILIDNSLNDEQKTEKVFYTTDQ